MNRTRTTTQEVNGVRFTRQVNADISHYGYGGEPVYYAPAPARTTTADITFSKLSDGSWGIKGVSLIEGATVTVTKKDGTTSEVIVGKIAVDGSGQVITDREGRVTASIARAPRVTTQVVAEVTVETTIAAVPDGRYAVYNDDQSVNDIAFYKVENVTEGKWDGFTFVKQIVGPDEQRLSQKQGKAILAKITAFGLREASQLFGHSTRKCGVCNINLTNKDSREYGIGPDCRAKYGW